ncbi:hypothetical protein D9M68_803390 [compost metagenome]
MRQILEYFLDHELRATIRIGRNTCRGIFADWNLFWLTINGCRGTEDKMENTRMRHRPEKCQTTADIVVIIIKRLLHTFTHCLETGEVQNGRNAVSGE